MRITNITVNNFQGLRHAALAVSEPLLLVSGDNGAGKSSLLDAIAMAFTGQPRRVSLKKDMGQLVTEGQKKGEAHVTWLDDQGEEQASWVMLPKGTTAPLLDSAYLPFVLDASKFAGLDGKDRRRMLFDLTGSKMSANVVSERLEAKGAAPALIEKIKPMLKAGPQAASDQAKEYASEARGAWKQLTGEAYGSDKANGWEPAEVRVDGIEQSHIDQVATQVQAINQDLDEAQQTLGGHKAAINAGEQRQQRIKGLQEVADQLDRRRVKLAADKAHQTDMDAKLAEAREAAEGDKPRAALECPCCSEKLAFEGGVLIKHEAPAKVADPEAARRATEYAGYLESALRAVQNSERDVKAAEDAAAQVKELEGQATSVPLPAAIANAEQAINEMRQERDKLNAKREALQDAFTAANGRSELIAKAAQQHELVQAWSLIAEALGPNGIPADILGAALTPFNDLLAAQAATAAWQPVVITADIDITYGGRLYGLLSESEKWRADTLLAIAIARLSGLRFLLLDRFDVLQPSARPQALKLLLALTRSGDLASAVMAGTMKEPMAKVPAGIQHVWIAGGVIDIEPASAAA